MINRKVTYGRLQSLGDYSNVKVEVTLETDLEVSTVAALVEAARHEVEAELDRASEHAGRGLVFSREQTFTMSVYKEENAVVIHKAPSATAADSYRINYVNRKIAECYHGWQVYWEENPFADFTVGTWKAEKVIAIGKPKGAFLELMRKAQFSSNVVCKHFFRRSLDSVMDQLARENPDFQIYNVTDDNISRLPLAIVETTADAEEDAADAEEDEDE
jgi:hypothetical protein